MTITAAPDERSDGPAVARVLTVSRACWPATGGRVAVGELRVSGDEVPFSRCGPVMFARRSGAWTPESWLPRTLRTSLRSRIESSAGVLVCRCRLTRRWPAGPELYVVAVLRAAGPVVELGAVVAAVDDRGGSIVGIHD